MARFALLFFLVLLAGCRPHDQRFFCREGASEFVMDSYLIRQGKMSILQMEGECVEELPCSALEEYEDGITEDDILNIAIYHPTRKDLIESIHMINQVIGFRVTEGCIHIPDIYPVKVEGLSINEARIAIQNAFRQNIEDVDVFLSYRDRLKKKVDIAGLTKVPYLPVDGKIRLYEVLAKAGIPTNANFFRSYVERDCQLLPVDMHKLMVEGDMCQNIVMRGGDKVYIADPGDSRVMIMGEVFRPTAIPLSYGYISLREAIVMAGGIPFTGDKRYI
ncbi:MAG: polysaccharide biosynthesis/export family protein, partial [Chlamydiia bacterium]|nr:polysaccharide biosynthesis/export family protein [Chlamydiia bacterium]